MDFCHWFMSLSVFVRCCYGLDCIAQGGSTATVDQGGNNSVVGGEIQGTTALTRARAHVHKKMMMIFSGLISSSFFYVRAYACVKLGNCSLVTNLPSKSPLTCCDQVATRSNFIDLLIRDQLLRRNISSGWI